MIETRAPGKLYVAGEYAVVTPGQPAVLVAVDRCITIRLTESRDSGRIHSSEYGQAPLVWVRESGGENIVLEHRPADYVLSAISAVEELRAAMGTPPRYFDLNISSELDDAGGRKFGLGSSGAVTVATIAALDEFYSLGLTRTERFKLAVLATIAVAPKASGGDLAASTFGGWIRYASPDRAALKLHREVHGVASALHCSEWSGSSVTRVTPPDSLRLLVGWTGSPASTERLVTRVHEPDNGPEPGDGSEPGDGPTSGNEPIPGHAKPRPFTSFTSESHDCVDSLVRAFEADDAPGAFDRIRQARHLLQRLGESSSSLIETQQLASLCDIAESHGAAAKPSGAGGGDCGIALTDAGLPIDGLLRDWESHGIRRLSLSPHRPEGGIDDF